MNSPLFTLIGIILIAVGLWGLLSGRVIAGARGLHSHYYSRADNPVTYWGFILVYLGIGVFILTKAN